MNPTIRVGLEGGRRPVIAACRSQSIPVLVSANSLWSAKRKRFGGWNTYAGLDVALDSGGFVAMRRFGGYRFTVAEYAALAQQMRPTWWAQMDFCCEPELCADRAGIWKRIDSTAEHLRACQDAANVAQIQPPLIVLQGWKPSDYTQGPIYEQDYNWPELVGVGSVCRRSLTGPDGLLSVIAALDKVLPPHTKLHLFGVKGAALARLAGHPRFGSMDSMAWSFRARMHAREKKVSCNGDLRAAFMLDWRQKQLTKGETAQLTLL